MAEMAVQGLLEFWPCKNVNKLISGCLLIDSAPGEGPVLKPCSGWVPLFDNFRARVSCQKSGYLCAMKHFGFMSFE